MTPSDWTAIGLGVFVFLYSLIGYLISRNVNKAEAAIDDLYKKHESDSQRLSDLELKIASNYYHKQEINALFEQLRNHVDSRFDRIERYMEERVKQ